MPTRIMCFYPAGITCSTGKAGAFLRRDQQVNFSIEKSTTTSDQIDLKYIRTVFRTHHQLIGARNEIMGEPLAFYPQRNAVDDRPKCAPPIAHKVSIPLALDRAMVARNLERQGIGYLKIVGRKNFGLVWCRMRFTPDTEGEFRQLHRLISIRHFGRTSRRQWS